MSNSHQPRAPQDVTPPSHRGPRGRGDSWERGGKGEQKGEAGQIPGAARSGGAPLGTHKTDADTELIMIMFWAASVSLVGWRWTPGFYALVSALIQKVSTSVLLRSLRLRISLPVTFPERENGAAGLTRFTG